MAPNWAEPQVPEGGAGILAAVWVTATTGFGASRNLFITVDTGRADQQHDSQSPDRLGGAMTGLFFIGDMEIAKLLVPISCR